MFTTLMPYSCFTRTHYCMFHCFTFEVPNHEGILSSQPSVFEQKHYYDHCQHCRHISSNGSHSLEPKWWKSYTCTHMLSLAHTAPAGYYIRLCMFSSGLAASLCLKDGFTLFIHLLIYIGCNRSSCSYWPWRNPFDDASSAKANVRLQRSEPD